MITGALLLKKEKVITYGICIKKYCKRILLALFIAALCFSSRHCPLWLTPGALLLLLPLFWFTLVKFAQNELPVIERAFYRLLLAAVDGSAEAI